MKKEIKSEFVKKKSLQRRVHFKGTVGASKFINKNLYMWQGAACKNDIPFSMASLTIYLH